MTALLLAVAACSPPPVSVSVEADADGISVRTQPPAEQVELATASGVPVTSRRLTEPLETVELAAMLTPGETYRVTVMAGGGRQSTEVMVPAVVGPVAVEVAAPLGQATRPWEPGARLAVPVVAGGEVDVGVWLRARQPGDVQVRLGAIEHLVSFTTVGEVRDLSATLSTEPLIVGVGAEQMTLVPREWDPSQAEQSLSIRRAVFPVDADGEPLPAQASDRLRLPPRWWTGLLAALGVPGRLDVTLPAGHEAVTVRNGGEVPWNVMIRARTLDSSGAPAAALAPRLRDQRSQDQVGALVEVPANGEVTVRLPVWVDPEALAATRVALQREVVVVPLGSSEPVARSVRPWVVARAGMGLSLAFGITTAISLLGIAVAALGGRRLLQRLTTTELVTIALFGSLTFVVATASQLLGHGLGAVLGPFAPFVTGWIDETFRTCLLATLVTLIPRPGVVALAAVLGWLLRGVALGSLHPGDLLYLGNVVVWLECWLWLAGLTRTTAWRDESRVRRLVRLIVGFGIANVGASAAGLVSSMVLYRLWIDPRYAAALLAGPGFVYVAFGCWLAVDFAASLRRVES